MEMFVTDVLLINKGILSSGSWWVDREAWCAAVNGIAKSWTWLSDWTEMKFKTVKY